MFVGTVAGSGKHQIEVKAFSTDDGFIVHVLGGEKPHVGAVVLSIPRQSLTGDGSISCTTSILPLTKHKDHIIARPIAELLAKMTEKPIVAVAGVHVENATCRDLKEIKMNAQAAKQDIVDKFEKILKQ